MGNIISVENVNFQYENERMILKNVSLSIARGELFTLLGPNGAGKSTLLNCIAGLLVPNDGKILLDGQCVHKISPPELARKIAYVPQTLSCGYGVLVRD